jgi:glycosyltransferase involved in cell wall biosynthesis
VKILHIITGLNNGGAEGVLYRLCKYDLSAKHIVVSMMDEGKYGSLLREAGVEVYRLNMQKGRVTLTGLWLLFKLIRQNKPDIIQTWMYHADLIGGVVARLAGVKNIFWNIRQSAFDEKKSKKTSILIAKLCARLSGFVPKRVVCCAEEAVRVHVDLGYTQSKMTVIGNGYDLSQFAVNTQFTSDFKAELSVKLDQVLLGMVGRFDPQKDHFGLFEALAIVKQTHSNFKFALIGKQLSKLNIELVEAINHHQLPENLILLDQRTDIPVVMNGLDIHVLSSAFGEAFPNVLAEAMGCGTPCVTTDVGDAALIVGETGWVVPPKDPKALANVILQAIEEKQANHQAWLNRKQACRERIVENFGIDTMIKNYHQVWVK